LTPKSCDIPISNAAPFSGVKTFVVELSGATGAALGAPASTTVLIYGDAQRATVSLSAATYTVAQNAGSLTVTVNRTGYSGGPLTVGYGTANSSAIAGTDYTSERGVLRWAFGETAPKSFVIPISNAKPFAGTKTLAVALASATGALIGTSSAVATIKGDGSSGGGGGNSAMGQTAAARLLMQGTMGATLSELTTTGASTYDAWFAAQAVAPISLQLPQVPAWNAGEIPPWWYNAVNGTDQLRLRMAFALSEIFVTSAVNQVLYTYGQGLAYYYDQLSTNALGNFRTLMSAVSTSPEMGEYLTFFKNDVPNPSTGVQPDENYARELMQLFTIGLWQLNQDGTQKLDGSGNPIPTYTQTDVANLSKVFTGWGSNPTNSTGENAWTYDLDMLHPMVCYANHHDTEAKTLVGGVSIAAGGTCQSDMAAALNALFNHPNTAPFISKQLIQRLVTSNPSPAYVSRVAAAFANDGTGVRGNLLAVAKAILTDPEATTVGTAAGSGKLREPVLRLTALWRAFSATQSNGVVTDQIITNAASDFGEGVLQSPTVFNFFTPSYQRAGPLSNAGLVVPEFQITNEYSIVQSANDLQYQTYKFATAAGAAEFGVDAVGGQGRPGANDMVLHTAAWESAAANPATLVTQLGLVFMPGQMPTTMYNTLVSYVSAIPATTPANRVIEAASLMITSPQYAVQH
jgi:uncharacterized protein (DUF1800 family)